VPCVRRRDRERQRAGLPRGPGLPARRDRLQRGRARDRGGRLMPWRRPRKREEPPINVSRAIEETLEDAAAAEDEDDAVDLAGVDGASTVEAATGELDEGARAPSALAEQLARVELGDAPVVTAVRTAPRPED